MSSSFLAATALCTQGISAFVEGDETSVRAVHALSPESASAIPTYLVTIDRVVTIAAAILLFCVVAGWLLGSRRDPLRTAPSRRHQLAPDGIAMIVLVYFLTAFLATGLLRGFAAHLDRAVSDLFAGTLAQIGGIGACIFVAAGRSGGEVGTFLFGSERRRGRTLLLYALSGGLMAIGLCPLVRDLTVAIILHLQPAFDFKSHATIRALHDPNQPTAITVMLWFGAAVVAPTAEELFFRGILQTWFATALRSRWLAIAVTSIAFGGVHLAQVHAVAALAALAVLLGYIYERTGSLATVVLIHGLFNLKSLAWDALSNAPVTPYGV